MISRIKIIVIHIHTEVEVRKSITNIIMAVKLMVTKETIHHDTLSQRLLQMLLLMKMKILKTLLVRRKQLKKTSNLKNVYQN